MIASMTTGGVWLIIALAAASATVVWLAASKGVSGRPQWWLVRGGTLAIGTTLLALAVLAPGVVGQLADLAFSGPASGDGAAGAELATRVLLAILALAVLTVPGTWADVLVGFVLVLTISAVWVDYGERRSALKKSPSVPVMPRTLGDDDLRVLLPKTRTVAPATELAKGADATLAAVVEERDPQGRIATVARTYDIILPLAVPASKLTDDVPVDVSTAAGIDIKQFLADLTAAKALRLLPSRFESNGKSG